MNELLPQNEIEESLEAREGRIMEDIDSFDDKEFYCELIEYFEDNYGVDFSRSYIQKYAKPYCEKFSKSKILNKNKYSREWIDETRKELQAVIVELIKVKILSADLSKVDWQSFFDSPEFTKTAFESHLDCYLKGGIKDIFYHAPQLLGEIIRIISKELLPNSSYCCEMWKQIFSLLVKFNCDEIRLIKDKVSGQVGRILGNKKDLQL